YIYLRFLYYLLHCRPISSYSLFSSSIFIYLYNTLFFFFTAPATTEIYTLSLHDALPISLPALAEAAATGEVDAVFLFSAFYFGAQSNGFTPLGTGVGEFLPNSPQSVWIASQEYAANNVEALERFREVLDTANALVEEDEETVRNIYHENTELPADFIDNVMVLAPLSSDLPQDGWERLVDVMVTHNELPEPLAYDEIVWDGAR